MMDKHLPEANSSGEYPERSLTIIRPAFVSAARRFGAIGSKESGFDMIPSDRKHQYYLY
jgi:hypothetical protein